MYPLNKVFLLGRLGADPIRRETKKGMAVVHFPLATSRWVKKENQESGGVEETEWHSIVAWGKLAENCFLCLEKGSPVFLEGQIKKRSYELENEEKKYVFEIHASKVSFLKTRDPHKSEPLEEQEESLTA